MSNSVNKIGYLKRKSKNNWLFVRILGGGLELKIKIHFNKNSLSIYYMGPSRIDVEVLNQQYLEQIHHSAG